MNPFVLGGALASGLGSAYNNYRAVDNENRMRQARFDAWQETQDWQKPYQEEAAAALAATTAAAGSDTEAANRAAHAQSFSDAIAALDSGSSIALSNTGNAPSVVQNAMAAAAADSDDRRASFAESLGNLQAYNLAGADTSRALASGAREQSRIGNGAQGMAALAPVYIAQQEQNAYRDPGMFGDLLQLGGSALTTGLGMGWFR